MCCERVMNDKLFCVSYALRGSNNIYSVLTGTLFIFHSNVADGSDPFDVQFACNSSPD